jgi:5-methylcytosine-specific restriction protein A
MDFISGKTYSRPDVKDFVGLGRHSKGGNWDTGIVEYEGEFFIFANVGTEGRTGHNYGNSWEDGALRWYHKTGSHLGWNSVNRLLSNKARVHVFWRAQNEEPFTYSGVAKPIDVADTSPVEILWVFGAVDVGEFTVADPAELPRAKYPIGAAKQILVNSFERSPTARAACLAHHGNHCAVCDLLFEDTYGDIGAGFVHVHHLIPLYLATKGYEVDPINDLRPVCPNCHAMLHRRRPPYSIDEMRERVKVSFTASKQEV